MPGIVSILCAAYPGNDAVVPLSRTVLNGFESGNPRQVMADLFPTDRTAARNS